MSIISAGTALLLAPKSGRELRTELKSKATQLKESGGEKAQELVDDFKTSYLEVEKELEEEQAKLDAKQEKLNQTIEEIEKDLNQKGDKTKITPAQASHALYADEKLGDVKGTPFEPDDDQAIPKEEVEEALHDNDLSEDDSFQLNKEEVEKEKDASLKVNPNN